MPETVLARLKALHPQEIDLSLDRMERLLAALGNPEQKLPPVIHIAGTNGKGSTLAFIRAILEAGGYSVHAYTSPHLVRFNERIVLAGQEIDDTALKEVLQEVERVNAGLPITFFEATTAAAFLAFAAKPADVLLLETGLGGRLDATNVVKWPLVSIISPIHFDHQEYLGRSLTAIAREKAGIFKSGVTAILAKQLPPVEKALEEQSLVRGTPLLTEGRNWFIKQDNNGLTYEGVKKTWAGLNPPNLIGRHQMRNAGLALAALEYLRGEFLISQEAINKGLASAHWPGRLQFLGLDNGHEIWLDGGHNQHAGRALANVFRNWRDKPLCLIVGMSGERKPADFLKPIIASAEQFWAVANPEKGIPPAQIAEAARKEGGRGINQAGSWQEALEQIRLSPSSLRVLITGSLYLVGDVLAKTKPGK